MCSVWIEEAVICRRAGWRRSMRINAQAAVAHARNVWRRYVDLPRAA